MSEARFIVGDTRKVLATLPDNSVDIVMTSPPFLALRSYLPADHPDKALEMGSEATPGEFIDGLLDVVEELDRVLAPHGSICIELGDTYSGSGDGWPLAKSLCLIPELFRFSLAYGFNPLTGRTTDRWRVRNVVRWCRPNPPVGALGDKFRPATSEMVIACKSAKRYFDLDAVRDMPRLENFRSSASQDGPKAQANDSTESVRFTRRDAMTGAPPLDFWVIPTQPYAGSHYATFPEALCVTPIKAMCPERVCVTCGEPSRRIVQLDGYTDHNGVLHPVGEKWTSGVAEGRGAHAGKPGSRTTTTTTTTGWTDCEHNAWRRGVVLDPFAGSGTTLCVATGHGRDAIGIDLDSRNAELAAARVGMFLTVELAA